MADRPSGDEASATHPGNAPTIAVESPFDSSSMSLDLDERERYQPLQLLGQGGMGEVHACRDRIVGRVIARKATRPRAESLQSDSLGHAQREARFVREARVQGQLEHPAVVPVYDVGRAADGRIFFTMKRVSGQTLANVLERLRAGDADTRQRFGRHRLLAAFQLVCQCIDYAHSRGVVHRDLKPANIMFGDFGEVYVLDWGVARIGSVPTGGVPLAVPETPSEVSGTPGYMAPEQLAELATVDGRMDVYALGAILFEILTFEPLHRAGDVPSLVASTRAGADARASLRHPEREVPPELETICVRATASDPSDRHPTVHALSADVEGFLEGHRDLELRREMAARHLAAAREHADLALEGGSEAVAARSRALAEVGLALALRPEASEATETLARLLTTPPRALPADARAAIEAQQNEEGRAASRLAGWIFSVMALSAIVIALIGDTRATTPTLLFFVASVVASLLGFANIKNPRDLPGVAIIVVAGIAMALTSVVLGPLVLTPMLAIALAIISMNVGRLSRFRPICLTIACMVVAVPAVLELGGVIPSSYVNVNGSWLIVSKSTIVPKDRVYPVGLLLMTLFTIVISSLFVWRMGDRIAELRAELQLYVWHLRQLVPEQARGPASTGLSVPPPRATR